jgi:hypothetical protein
VLGDPFRLRITGAYSAAGVFALTLDGGFIFESIFVNDEYLPLLTLPSTYCATPIRC